MALIAYCGIDCERCANYRKNENCLGCIIDQEMIEDCDIRQCCKEKRVAYCAECGGFPCEKMRNFYDGHPEYAYAEEIMNGMRKEKGLV